VPSIPARPDDYDRPVIAAVSIRPLRPADAPACDAIVASLPYHFGDPYGRELCARAVRESSGLVAVDGAEVAGFMTWRAWYDSAVEITWMAVHADRRRRGIGGRLIDALATASSGRHLVVTTLSESTQEPGVADGYAGTRAFYGAHGFEPVWEPAGWWNDENQAVLMIRVDAGTPA
jgi:ribosomal protein S18 acetylase RimI-like enzyme